MRPLVFPLVLLLVFATGLSGCFDVGIAPSDRTYGDGGSGLLEDGQDPSGDGGGQLTEDGDGSTSDLDGGASDPDTVGPPAPPLGPALWSATFTTPLEGGGLTLQPLGARSGFTGVLKAPGGLQLEALP